MANQVRIANIFAEDLVDTTSRYAESDVVYYGDNNIITFKTYKRSPLPENAEDQFAVITKGTEYRPDLISHRIYGTPNFWWRLLEANGMFDISEFKTGVNIRIPSIFTIFSPSS